MMSVADALKLGESRLAASGVAEPRRDSASLLAFVLKKDKSFFYAHPEHVLSADESAAFDSAVARRSSREPLQYITGVQEFYGLEFEVTPEVLIPRPETEMVVEEVLALLRADGSFCEIGIGSGCIAVSILANRPDARAVGLDISPGALEITRRNAEKHGVADRLRTALSDVFATLEDTDRFDMILSNPPYVPIRDITGLQAEVRDFEPHIALTDGVDGLSIVRTLVDDSPRHLIEGGYLLVEIGFDQSEEVAAMFDRESWYSVDLLPDLQGIPRLVKARLW